MRRVVITGLGIVSSLGNNKDEVKKSLYNASSGISFDQSQKEMGFRSQVSGQIDLNLEETIDRKFLRFMGDGASYNYIAMKEAIQDAKNSQGAESFVEKSVRGSLEMIPGLAGLGAAQDIGRGFVRNNRMEMIFEGIGRRTFSFSFKMMPKSEKEAIDVDKIVRMFRFYMAPSFMGDVSQSRTMIVPATFDISYLYAHGKQNNFLNKISTCVLESCNVTYGGERVQFFRPTGDGAPPVETQIDLTFKELDLITRERLALGF